MYFICFLLFLKGFQLFELRSPLIEETNNIPATFSQTKLVAFKKIQSIQLFDANF